MIEDLKKIREALQHIVDGYKPGGATNITVAPKALNLLDNLIANCDEGDPGLLGPEADIYLRIDVAEPVSPPSFLDTPETLEAVADAMYQLDYYGFSLKADASLIIYDLYIKAAHAAIDCIKRLAAQSSEGGNSGNLPERLRRSSY